VLALLLAGGAVQPVAAQSDGGIGALVGFVNGWPDEGPVDVYVDGKLVVESLVYGEVTEGFELSAGSAKVAVSPAGEGLDAAVLEKTTRWDAGAAYIVAAISQPDEAEEAILRTWRLDQGDVAADSGLVQLLHISPDTPSVDVAVADGDVLLADTGFGDLSASVEVQSGDYTLEMQPAGSGEAVQTVEDVPVEADRVCTVIGLGFLADDGQLDIVTFYAPLSSAQLASTGTGIADTVAGLSAWTLWALAAVVVAAVGATLRIVKARDGASSGFSVSRPVRNGSRSIDS
jgi:hypothetical protein